MVDEGRTHDADRPIFDHKPAASEYRDTHCPISLVWQHAISAGVDVEHLRDLVELVHDGDAASRRSKSKTYTESRLIGLPAFIKAARSYAKGDPMLYEGIAEYLDANYGPRSPRLPIQNELVTKRRLPR